MMQFFDFFVRGLKSTDEWERYKEGRPSETQQEIASIKAQSEKQELEQTLGQKVDRLILVSKAIWELVRDSNKLSDQALFEKVKEIDLRDGTVGGKIVHTPKPCPKCGRTVSTKTGRCMYCGTTVPFATPLDTV